jgi:hypothetical protein
MYRIVSMGRNWCIVPTVLVSLTAVIVKSMGPVDCERLRECVWQRRHACAGLTTYAAR